MPAAYEEILAYLLAQLPEPLEQQTEPDGTLTMTSGEPPEVIVRLSGSQVGVAEFAIEWQGPYTPVVQPIEVGVVDWTVISEDAALRVIKALLTGARESRREKFRVCAMCERSTPPEWMHDDEVCQSCAERHLGVVH